MEQANNQLVTDRPKRARNGKHVTYYMPVDTLTRLGRMACESRKSMSAYLAELVEAEHRRQLRRTTRKAA